MSGRNGRDKWKVKHRQRIKRKKNTEKGRERITHLEDDVRRQGLSSVFAGNKIKIYPVWTE